MIGFLRGKVMHLQAGACYLDVNGVGYRVLLSGAAQRGIQEGAEALLFTHLAFSTRDETLQLYGFLTEAEQALFFLLTSVTGVGPKAALGILATLSPQELQVAVRGRDTKLLTKAPGIGKKTAERILLELRDKLPQVTLQDEHASADNVEEAQVVINDAFTEALEGLVNLGYGRDEAETVLHQVGTQPTAEAYLRRALREFARR